MISARNAQVVIGFINTS